MAHEFRSKDHCQDWKIELNCSFVHNEISATFLLENENERTIEKKTFFGLLIFRFYFTFCDSNFSQICRHWYGRPLIFSVNAFGVCRLSGLLHEDDGGDTCRCSTHERWISAVSQLVSTPPANTIRTRNRGICNYCNFDNSKHVSYRISLACILFLSAGLGAPHFILTEFIPFWFNGWLLTIAGDHT